MVANTRSRSPGAVIAQRQSTLTADELDIASGSVFEVVNNGFIALRRQTQTLEERRTLLAQYGQATRQLRKALASSSSSDSIFFPVLLFALYEMIVNLDPNDKTWQTHLDGLLSLVSRSPVSSSTLHLHRAVKLIESDSDINNNLSAVAAVGDPEVACRLLDVTKLRLRKILPDTTSLFDGFPERPRKIDVQKIRVSIKKIYLDLELFPTMISKRKNVPTVEMLHDIGADVLKDISAIRLNEYRTLQIMTASFLLWSGDFLHPNDGYHNTKEFLNLRSAIEDAAKGIRSTIEAHISTLFAERGQHSQNTMEFFVRAAMLLFPLYCASRASCLDETQRKWFTDSLCLLGSCALIPKAFALVRWI
ncbi:hypothetical protein PFICI_10048 [Pestalotiopsis fici W106-1]|uniref:Uncharacterized protein n=1 Tax=Pestalotiopsis fici (strain W106-1 / CGMCC3.15140) TaxID=1229662 RepID=W3WYL8_PESFW|nr:uncharacterized protein PFICI_10048 [Pestalotiopsis fici W106-1]ETS77986.1 hypothetical protein PFICI_10048 [Pestalotiopsis fici W106-1]